MSKARFHGARTERLPADAEDAAYEESGRPEEEAVHAMAAAKLADEPGMEAAKASLAARQIDRWIAAMERLRLSDYVRYVDDRKRLFWTSFWGGMARGVGMAIGFTILGAVLVLILQDLARHNLPVIGDVLAQIVSIVQKRLE